MIWLKYIFAELYQFLPMYLLFIGWCKYIAALGLTKNLKDFTVQSWATYGDTLRLLINAFWLIILKKCIHTESN